VQGIWPACADGNSGYEMGRFIFHILIFSYFHIALSHFCCILFSFLIVAVLTCHFPYFNLSVSILPFSFPFWVFLHFPSSLQGATSMP
jgi:hypothetical protein